MKPEEKAQQGLALIKEAIVEYLRAHPSGTPHGEIVKDLALESDFEGKHHNYLSWSALGLLLKERRVRYERRGRNRIYFAL